MCLRFIICLFAILVIKTGLGVCEDIAYISKDESYTALNNSNMHTFEYTKNIINEKVDANNSMVREVAIKVAGRYQMNNNNTINQIYEIYEYSRNGSNYTSGWLYETKPFIPENLNSASDTIEFGKSNGSRSGVGDCNDFAILTSALIEAIGGSTRIVVGSDHAYAEVYLGQAYDNTSIKIINWLKESAKVNDVHVHMSDDNGIWLNLDWYANYPGGPFYEQTQEVVIPIGDQSMDNLSISEPIPREIYYKITVENSNIIEIYDKSTRKLVWDRTFLNSSISKALVGEIDRNKKSYEVLVVTNESGERPDRILVYDDKGYEYKEWNESIYSGGDDDAFKVMDVLIEDLTSDGTNEIIIASGDTYFTSSRLFVMRLEVDGLHKLGEYWNPGPLTNIYIEDVNNDGIKEIICVGKNNTLHDTPSVVFALDGYVMDISRKPSDLLNRVDIQKESELWYYYAKIPSEIASVRFLDYNTDGNMETHITLNDSCSWYLDYNGDVEGRGRGSWCEYESDLIRLR